MSGREDGGEGKFTNYGGVHMEEVRYGGVVVLEAGGGTSLHKNNPVSTIKSGAQEMK